MRKPTATALFAERLRAVRTGAGISQAQLGERLGLTFEVASTRINRYERGKHPPDLDTAERLADELGVPFPYFVARDPLLARAIDGFAELARDRQQLVLRVLLAQLKEQRAQTRTDPATSATSSPQVAKKSAAKKAVKKAASKVRKVAKPS